MTVETKLRESLVKDLVWLSSVAEGNFSRVLTAFEAALPVTFTRQTQLRIAGSSGVETVEAERIVDIAFSLGFVLSAESVEASVLVQQASDDVRGFSTGENESLAAIAADRVKRILSLQDLQICGKATTLLMDAPTLLSDSRLILDARPVFGLQPESLQPRFFVARHSLVLSYLEQGQLREFSAVCDIADLRALKLEIERAIDKEDRLRQACSSHPVAFLSLE